MIAGKFSNLARTEKTLPEIIVAAMPTIELSYEAVRYGKENGVPVVVDVRDLWPDIFYEFIPKPFRAFARLGAYGIEQQSEFSLRNATGITAVSSSYLNWALAKGGRQKSDFDEVFPLGYQRCSKSSFEFECASAELCEMGVDRSKFICWFIGTFGETYDLAPIIKTAKDFLSKGRLDVQFVFSGVGDNEALWRKMAKGLSNVVFTGWVNSSQIECLGSTAKIGLAAYSKGAPQSLPNKLFEYLSFGLPVLSSLAGEAEILLRENACGYSYHAANSDEFAKYLETLIRDTVILNRMSGNAEKLFNSKYAAEAIYPSYLNYLEKMVEHNA